MTKAKPFKMWAFKWALSGYPDYRTLSYTRADAKAKAAAHCHNGGDPAGRVVKVEIRELHKPQEKR